MSGDSQALADMIRVYDRANMHVDPKTQKGMQRLAQVKATINNLKQRMSKEELAKACDLL